MQKKINQSVYERKLKKLQLQVKFLDILESSSLFISLLYVILSALGIINEKTQLGNISSHGIELIVFFLSVIMSLSIFGKVRKNMKTIKKYLDSKEENLLNEIVLSNRKEAEKVITHLDIIKDKFKRGEKIEIHDKRDIVRSYILCIAILFMAGSAVIILFFLDLNFPVVIAWEIVIAYIFVMLEFLIYQFTVNRSESNVFSEKHKRIISFEEIKAIESMRYLQKILYMRCDRLKSYMLALKICIITMNILSISITIIVTNGDDRIKRWFGFEDSFYIVSIMLGIASIIFYYVDRRYGERVREKINDLEIYMSLSYSKKKYKEIKKRFPNLLHQKGLFDRPALDIARGTYEYNIEKISSGNGVIAFDYLFTVRHRIINNIPRVKFTSLVSFLFLGSILVWYKKNIFNIGFVCIITIIIFFVTFLGMFLFDKIKYREWTNYIKELHINQEVN